MKTAFISFVRNLRVLVLAGMLAGVSVSAAVWRVKPAGNDANSGASWDQAKRTVTQALVAAAAGDEVWVAGGVYAEHVEMKPDVALYGGFVGGETTLAERDWVHQLTVLDGTTNGIVVLVSGGGPATIVDGFTIRNGLGAGVRLYNTQGVLRHNVIRDNISSASLAYGAGVSVKNLATNAVATIEHNVIVYNYAYDGGGISCIDASPRVTFNVIAWNFAQQDGGGISCWRDSSPLIANNVISANTAFTLDGVAVPIGGGGIFATADDLDGRPHPTAKSLPLILNNVIVANGGWHGGGICLADSNGGVPRVVNNTVVANNGAGIFWGSSSLPSVALIPELRNNLVAFNPWGLELAAGTPTNAIIAFNCVYGNQVHGTALDYVGLASRTGVDGNISVDPKLANYAYSEFHLQPDSPCINAGTNLAEAVAWLDIDEQPRITGGRIDIGADESAGETWTATAARLHVRMDGSDSADGLSWATAKKTLQAAINAAMVRGGEVWVGGGTYVEHVYVPAFVHLFGGFAGSETDRAARDRRLHPTVVDGAEIPNVVVVQNGGYRVCTLDGFTVCRGGRYTAGAGLNKYGRGGNGGGLHINLSSPIIANNVITSNSLAYDNVTPPPGVASYGAGIYCKISYACIVSNIIQDNEILNDFDGSGGAIYCERWSRPLIQGNTLTRNHAAYGPAIYSLISTPAIRDNVIASNAFYNTYPFPLYFGSVQGAVTLIQNDDCSVEGNVFRGNTAAMGAAIYGGACVSGRIQNNLIQDNWAYDPTAFGGTGGGLYWTIIPGATGTVSILHNTFVGNIATNSFSEQGGGLTFVLTENSNRLLIANNLFASNSSGIYQIPSTPLARPILERNNLVNLSSNYLNLPPGPTDLSVAPGFVGSGDWRLRTNSPCVDAGTSAHTTVFDQSGVPRPLDGNNDGVAAPDVGAFETLHPGADSDHDQMPDAWELANALNPVTDDAAADEDHDRVSNGDEYVAGTRPSDPTSVLALLIEIDRVQGGVRLEWFGVNDRTYTVECTDRLPGPASWPTLTNGVLGKDAKLEFRDASIPGPERFYRVRVELAPQ
jgi:hypothetical protein